MGFRIWGSSYAICCYRNDLDQEEITRQLDACLINTSEINQDWRLLYDPYQWKYDKRM